MVLRCTQQGCDGPEGGICIENLEFDQCPHVQDTEVEAEAGVEVEVEVGQNDIAEEDQLTTSMPEMVTTLLGPNIDAAGCDALLRQRNASLISLVGGPDVGKTTLLAGIYELCRRGKLQGFGFAGSETILGFEERCFLARVRSGRTEADTQRTTRLSFTHLRIGTDNGIVDWVISDRPGEHFDRARDFPDEMTTFTEVVRADILLILIDGARLLSSHQAALAEAQRITMILDQHSLLESRQTMLVVTKSDKLVKEEDRKIVEQRVDRLVKSVEDRNSNISLPVLFVASRARPGKPFEREGFDELLSCFQITEVEKEFALVRAERSTKRFPDAIMLPESEQP